MDSRHLPILIAVVGVGLIYMYWQLYKKNQLLEQQLYYLHNHVQQLTSMERNQEPIVIDLDEDDENENINDNLPKSFTTDNEEVNYGYEENSESDENEPEGIEQHEDNIREIDEESTPAEDIVITKISHCQHILQSGKNKGSSCGKLATDNGFCKNHSILAPEPL